MNTGICPKCNGTGHMPCPDSLRHYGQKSGWYGYRAVDDTVTCDNCGGQYQYGRATGKVPLNTEGVPCLHEYVAKSAGRSLTNYTCKHCNNSYQIDSGD